MNRFARTVVGVGAVLWLASCGDTVASGPWPFGGDDNPSTRQVELYAELIAEEKIHGVVDPDEVVYGKYPPEENATGTAWRRAPPDEKFGPVVGLTPELMPALNGYIQEAQEGKPPPSNSDGDPDEVSRFFRAGIFDVRGFAEEDGNGEESSIFHVESAELKDCRTARATKMRVFPGPDDMCLAFGQERCDVNDVQVDWVPDEPESEYFDRNYFRVRIAARCSKQRSVEMTFRLEQDSSGRTFAGQWWARGFKEDDRLELTCRKGDQSETQSYRELPGWSIGRLPDTNRTPGVRALGLRFDPAASHSVMSKCPDGEVVLWGTIEPEAYPVDFIAHPNLYDQLEAEPVDE